MNYIENIYICLVAPLLIALLCLRGSQQRMMLFLLGGMTVCLLSSYISTFLTAVHGASILVASLEIAPMVEELMKLFPVLFYLLIFEPKKECAAEGALMIAVGFATFENACYLAANGAAQLFYLLIRGFGTGAMHVVCGLIVAMGLLNLWDRLYLRVAGTVGLLSVAATYHAIYNVLVSQTGPAAWVGYLIPVMTALLTLVFGGKQLRKIRSAM